MYSLEFPTFIQSPLDGTSNRPHFRSPLFPHEIAFCINGNLKSTNNSGKTGSSENIPPYGILG